MKFLYLFFILILVLGGCSKELTKKETDKYTQLGLEITQATQRTLELNLTQKMRNGGVKSAIPFCNTMAYPLTEQMSQKYDVKIKRVSNKNRNDKNKASIAELKIIEQYLNKAKNKIELKPVVEVGDSENIYFYAPIILQNKCLVCHGTVGKKVTKQTDSLIKSFYPKDLATGFKNGDLRGVWSIQFKKRKL